MAAPQSTPQASAFDSWSEDLVQAVGLRDIDVTVNADVTVAANSTAK